MYKSLIIIVTASILCVMSYNAQNIQLVREKVYAPGVPGIAFKQYVLDNGLIIVGSDHCRFGSCRIIRFDSVRFTSCHMIAK